MDQLAMKALMIGLLLLLGSGCSRVEVDCKNMTIKVEGAEIYNALTQAKDMLKDCPVERR